MDSKFIFEFLSICKLDPNTVSEIINRIRGHAKIQKDYLNLRLVPFDKYYPRIVSLPGSLTEAELDRYYETPVHDSYGNKLVDYEQEANRLEHSNRINYFLHIDIIRKIATMSFSQEQVQSVVDSSLKIALANEQTNCIEGIQT